MRGDRSDMKQSWKTATKVRQALLLGVTGVLLAACGTTETSLSPDAWNVGKVRSLPVVGGAYDTALRDGYVTLAAAEKDEDDWADTKTFLDQARLAAAGKRPLPDDLSKRDLLPDQRQAMTKARADLMEALGQGGRLLAPLDAARAQLQFDCWVQEGEENIPQQASEVAACKAGFEDALAAVRAHLASDAIVLLNDLDGGVGEVIVTPTGTGGRNPGSSRTLNEPLAGAEISPTQGVNALTLGQGDVQEIWGATLAAQPIPPKRFQLYFLSGGSTLTTASLALIPNIAADLKRRPVWQIEILGHTDRVGGASGNARLSAQRADAVKALLVSRGFAADDISTRGFGESMPLIPTADGVAEEHNRRVEVIVR